MDKIIEIKSSKNFPDSKTYRFQCDCLSAADAMDIDVEEAAKAEKFFIIRMDFIGTSKWDRIKYAWQILRGRWCWREFIVRQSKEDYQALSDIFNPDRKFSELP